MDKLFGCVIDKELVAVHESKKVASNYCNMLETMGHPNIGLVRVNTDKLDGQMYEDLYLVRYGDSYIQSKYFMLAKNDDKQFKYDLQYAKDVLMRILEFSTDKKEIKTISKTLLIINKEIDSIKCTRDPYVMKQLYELNSLYKIQIQE